MRLLIINPGSTSTKVALTQGSVIQASKILYHDLDSLQKCIRVIEQVDMRLQAIEAFLAEQGEVLSNLAAIVGRGGLLNPVSSGTYRVNKKMLEDLRRGKKGEHASNLGGILAQALADRVGIPAFIVDPPSVDEFEESARISGLPELPRHSQLHALNIRRVALRVAQELQKPLNQCNFIVVHIGGGISVAALRQGKIVDVNSANNAGPFTPERSGGLPARELLKICFSGQFTEQELIRRLNGQSGWVGYLGCNDGREVEKKMRDGEEEARLLFDGMAYQIAMEIGAMSAVLKSFDGVIYTGGLAHSQLLLQGIQAYVQYLGPSFTVPGENELLALAEGAVRVLNGEEQVRVYGS